MNAIQQAENIERTLMREKFAQWYNHGRFDDYITGTTPITKDEILQDIISLFNLKDDPAIPNKSVQTT